MPFDQASDLVSAIISHNGDEIERQNPTSYCSGRNSEFDLLYEVD